MATSLITVIVSKEELCFQPISSFVYSFIFPQLQIKMKWNENEEDFKIINLRARRLGDVLSIYKSLEEDRSGRHQHIVNN